MHNLDIKRLDHHGLVMGVIKDIKLIETIDAAVGRHVDEKLSVGQRVAAMVINGLGFTDQPLSLVNEFYKDIPVDVLFGQGITSEDFNRYSLSRALDRLHSYGIESLFSTIAAQACKHANVDQTAQSFDTTTFSFHGEYNKEYDEDTVKVTHGYSKDHRSDLKQIVTELLVSHDSGIPLCLKNCDGNASDNVIFKERTEQLIKSFKEGYVNLVTADSKFYSEANAQNWHLVQFVTRVPETIKEAKALIQTANEDQDWKTSSDTTTRFIAYDITHYNIEQRWLVCQSDDSLKRAEKSIEKQLAKEKNTIQKEVFHFEAKSFESESELEKAASLLGKKWKLYAKSEVIITQQARHEKPGRPSGAEPIGYTYKAKIQWNKNNDAIQKTIHRKASFVLATNVADKDLRDEEVISCYKKQQHVERGYRFLKDPIFFANGFYLKKTSRIEALIMIMTLALLVYTIAQKKLRESMKSTNTLLPNQTGKLVKNLSIRRAFQVMQGVYFVKTQDDQLGFVQGLTALQKQILELINGSCMLMYQLQAGKTNEHYMNERELENMAI